MLARTLLTVALVLLAGSAHATSITAALGGDQGCTTAVCTTQTSIFTSATGNGGGTLDVLAIIGFDATIGSALFSGVSGSPDVAFANVNYDGTASYTRTGPILFSVTTGSATISGDFNGNPFSTAANTVGGACVTVPTGFNCGLTFSFDGPDGNTYFHTLNLATVPEPGLALLLGAGLVALRRRV